MDVVVLVEVDVVVLVDETVPMLVVVDVVVAETVEVPAKTAVTTAFDFRVSVVFVVVVDESVDVGELIDHALK